MSNEVINYLTLSLADQLAQQKSAQEELAAIGDQIASLRDQLQQEMKDGAYKTLEDNGLQVSIRSKKYPQVVDGKALRAHLVSLEKEQDYIVSRFDQVKARNDGAKNGWPGVEVEERQELVVKVLS